MPETPVKRKRRSQPREEILAATLEVIVEKGLAATQINDVAAAVGMSPAGLLYHFGSRQELLLEALRFKDQRWIDRIDLVRIGDDPARVDTLIKLLLDPAPKQKAAWRRDWMVWHEAVLAAFHDDEVRAWIGSQDARWTGLIADVIGGGEDGYPAALALSSLIDGLSVRLLVFPAGLTHKQAVAIAHTYADQLLEFSSVVKPK